MNLPNLLLGFVISTLYGALFHFWKGGSIFPPGSTPCTGMVGLFCRSFCWWFLESFVLDSWDVKFRDGNRWKRSFSICGVLVKPN